MWVPNDKIIRRQRAALNRVTYDSEASAQSVRMTTGQPFTGTLKLPTDADLLAAAGRVALAHAHLEHVLRMTVKSLARVRIAEALLATQSDSAQDLRRRARKLFTKVTTDPAELVRFDAILGEAQNLARKRNALIHRPWMEMQDGRLVVKDDDHTWGDPPTTKHLAELADQIYALALHLNNERLTGFIKSALDRALPKP